MDPDWTERLARRGPKPKKRIVICEEGAATVRQVFDWFAGGLSITAVAAKLSALGVRKDHRNGKRREWHHACVRRMLTNRKYIGEWIWGATVTRRDSQGKKKQVPADADRIVRRERPELRIIAQDVWERVQKRLSEIHEVYGQKPHQKRRGPPVHPTQMYPQSLLGGLLFCGLCGARLNVQLTGGHKYLGCPTRRMGSCGLLARVRVDRAEKVVIEFVSGLLRSVPGWMEETVASMRKSLTQAAAETPATLKSDEARLTAVEKQIRAGVDHLLSGGDYLAERIRELEAEAKRLKTRIEDGRRLAAAPAEMPDDEWIRSRLAALPEVLGHDVARGALLLRKLLGKVFVHEIRAPGKKRGFTQLRFRLNGWHALLEVLGDRMPDVVEAAAIGPMDGTDSPEFCLDLGAPTRLDDWAPKIAEMRKAGVRWKDIAEATGLGIGRSHMVWKRWISGQGTGNAPLP